MLLFISLTTVIFGLYLFYPIYLSLQRRADFPETNNTEPAGAVSVIFLSYNGGAKIIGKIRFLLDEIRLIPGSELLVIDDQSSDGTPELLRGLSDPRLRVITLDSHSGIPAVMNLGVRMASCGAIIFCDQRQRLPEGVIKKLVVPLNDPGTGAVSVCISCYDKQRGFSLLRVHENYLKRLESRSGNLIGVYGPLYAVKKTCYSAIPSHIVLDDLYLSLTILSRYKVRMLHDLQITDENPDQLYGYARAKRYLYGLMQLISEKDIWKPLSMNQRIMLFWHKYFRLSIPVLMVFGCILLLVKLASGPIVLIILILLTLLFLIPAMVPKIWWSRRLRNPFNVHIYYFFAFFELLFAVVFHRPFLKSAK